MHKEQHNRAGLTEAQQVFISYRHAEPDQDLALALVSALERDGIQVFVDRRILVGTDWAAEIDKQLRSSKYFIVLISADSIRSDMVRQEIMLAHELKQQGKLRILPVRVNFTGALPYDLGSYLNSLQYALWQAGQAFDEVIDNLRLAIGKAEALPYSGRANDETDSPAQIAELHAVTELRGAPLPQIDPRVLKMDLARSSLELERGAMTPDSLFYVLRPSDVLAPGEN